VRYTINGLLLLCGLVAALGLSARAVPLTVLDDPSSRLSQTLPPEEARDASVAIAAGSQAIIYQSGDTVETFCDVASFKFGSFGGTDCWGWTAPDQTEYAIMGVYNGIAFVNTTTMQVVTTIPGPQNNCGSALWRDMKTYQHYAYAVSECTGTNDGLMVMDLQYLPDSVHFVGAFPISSLGYRTSHNLSIDTIQGYAYCEGISSADYSIFVLSLADPTNPTEVGHFGPSMGIHDMYAINDTVWVAEGYNPYWSMWDLSNKSNPQLITRVSVPAPGYVHNIWPTDDHQYVVTTEETSNKTIKVWDISDLQNISLLGQFLAPSNLAHNAQVKGDTVFMSHYESGVRVVDISDPNTPVEIAAYDTWGTENAAFNGCWGAYPYTQNGYVYGSNMDGTLFVLEQNEVILADTLWVDSVAASPGTHIRVDVHATNTQPLAQLTIPISWAGPYSMTLDSVSTAGLRTDYFQSKQLIGSDLAHQRIAYQLTASPSGALPDLDPGSGPVLSLFFTVPYGVSEPGNDVVITPYNSTIASFSNTCIQYLPDTVSGAVTVAGVCCQFFRGNVDGDPQDEVNVSDVSYLVAYLFQGGPEPTCLAEANVDGDPLNEVSVSDLTRLVDYLFSGGQVPALCL